LIKMGAPVSTKNGAITDAKKTAALMRVCFKARDAARSFGLDDADAEDVAGEAVAQAIATWDEFKGDSEDARAGWAWTITRNIVATRHRRRNTARQFEHELTETETTLRQSTQPVSPLVAATDAEAASERERFFSALDAGFHATALVVARQVAQEISRAEAAKLLDLRVESYDRLARQVKRKLRRAIVAGLTDPSELFGSGERSDS
jgi:RNA polymerase sigma factor (sigma-70 family)